MNQSNTGVKAVFLDRDGTLNEEVNYLHRPEDLRMIPGVPAALKRLKEAGFTLIVTTNQAGVGRGYYPESDVASFHEYFNRMLAADGAEIDAFYYCPHHPEHGIGRYREKCRCRKPETGMFEQAEADLAAGYFAGTPLPEGETLLARPVTVTASEYEAAPRCIDKSRSFMIGDKLIDTEAGHRFGVRSVLVGTGYGKDIRAKEKADGAILPDGTPKSGQYDKYVDSLGEAVDWILKNSETEN